ncbi:MAG: hypothetical protein O3A47_06195 [Chloroflexi bacterium]|nr:hypothetical protein [Chloroflexota bacterium]
MFTLIPEFDVLFPIPQLAGPAVGTGTVLPDTDLEFSIPVIGAPSGTALPNVDFLFDIPQAVVTTNVPAGIPDLPNTDSALAGFDIPDISASLPAAPAGVPNFPDTVADFDIPTPSVASAPAGVPNLPEAAAFFTAPDSPVIRGLGTDGSNFWVVKNGSPDTLEKLDSTGASTTVSLVGPSDSIEGVAFLNGFLWVLENLRRCFDIIDTTRCDRSHRIFKIDPADADAFAAEADWALVADGGKTKAILNTVDRGDPMGGITAEGSGATGTLWLGNESGFRLYNVSQSGDELSSPDVDSFNPRINGIAFSADLLYTSDSTASQISQWNKQGQRVAIFDIKKEATTDPVPLIRGMTFKTVSSSAVLHIGSSDGKVYRSFFAPTVTNTPRGITFSPSTSSVGEALWILTDAEPKDKLLKIDPDDGTLITSFSDDGFTDAPSKETQGITFFNSALWVIANEDFTPKLFKLNATTGAVLSTIDLSATAGIFDELGGITNDGTRLVLHTRNFINSVYFVNESGLRTGIEQGSICCPVFAGAGGLAFHTGRSQFFAGRNSAVALYDDALNFVQEFSLTQGASPAPSGIEGLTFNGNVFYVAHTGSGKVSKGFLASTATTKPRGLAFTPSTSTPGKAIWVLVDGEPRDKLLKVDPDTGLLITAFSDDGFVDAPSNKTEGITFLDTGDPTTSFLWIIANEAFERRLYKLNATTGALVSTFNLGNTAQIFDDVAGIANDGTNLIVYFQSFSDIVQIDTSGAQVQRSFVCCSNVFGAKALARHAVRNQFFAAKNNSLLTIKSNLQEVLSEQTLLVDSAPLIGNVEGMVFDQDLLYVARDQGGTGKISIGALKVSVTTDPRGLAFSPAGSSLLGSPIGRALWALVDGTPNDQILKLDVDTGALDTSFSTDGFADAPSANTQGITFLNGFLWIIANDGFDRRMYKVSATTGVLSQTFDLGQTAQVFDNVGGITNDGANLIVYMLSFNDLIIVDTSGGFVERRGTFGGGPQGGTGVAFRSSENQLLVSKGSLGNPSDISQWDIGGSSFDFVDEFLNVPANNVQGSTFIDDVLYLAHSGSGKISSTAVPSDITNNPRGLAYDAGADELYILVDGKARDHIVVVDPGTGVVARDFEAPSVNAESITFLNGNLFVGHRDQFFIDKLARLDPNNGAVLEQFQFSQFGLITGLSNNGTSLIAIPEFGFEALVLDPASGSETDRVFFFDPLNPGFFVDNLQALAFDAAGQEFFPAKAARVLRFDEIGRLIEEFNVTAPVGGIRGAVFVGGRLFLAESTGNTIRSTGIPSPAVAITTDPRGMATDGTDLFLAVDGSPKDKIMKLDQNGDLVAGFGDAGSVDSPGTDTGGLAFHDGFLYAVTNDERTIADPFGGFSIQSFPVISKLDPGTGEELARSDIELQDPFGPPQRLLDPIGALASDGNLLYAGVLGTQGIQGAWFSLDLGNLGFGHLFARQIDQFAGRLQFIPGFDAFEITGNASIPDNRSLIGTGTTGTPGVDPADTLSRFDRDTGVMFDQFVLAGTDIRGMAYIGSTLFMANEDANNVLGTALPENPGVELTLATNSPLGDDDFAANFSVTGTIDELDPVFEADPALFRFGRRGVVTVDITSHDEGDVLTNPVATISGTVDDASVTTVEVGIQLPFTEFVDDPVTVGVSEDIWRDIGSVTGESAFWHIACSDQAPGFPSTPRVSSPTCSWRYATPDAPSFNTGARTQGSLTTFDPITISQGSQISFFTGYATELSSNTDVKLVEVAQVTQDLQGNDQVGEFKPLAQIVGPGGGSGPAPFNALPGFRFVELEPLFINPNLGQVGIDLSNFAGQRVMVRFDFDSVNRFANGGEGWYLDDIVISGSGTETVLVSTTRPPLGSTLGGVLFSTQFELAEGVNILVAKATQPYAPNRSGQTSASVFVDTTDPIVNLFGIPSAVNSPVQTLLGSVDDLTLQLVDITQNGEGIFSQGEAGSLSIPVSLSEGLNTFVATATDGGGLVGTATFEVILDTASPTIVDEGAIFPVGSVSARTQDDIIFQVTADDSGVGVSGVARVELVIDGQVTDELIPAADIPEVVREQFGITGNFVRFESVPSGIPPGEFSIAIRATDNAGNTTLTDVSGDVTASLEAMNIFLFDGANLVGVNLQALGASPDFDVNDVVAQSLDTSVLDSNFVNDVIGVNLGSSTSSDVSLGDSTVDVADATGFAVGDRIAIGSGDTTLIGNTFPNQTTITVADGSAFAVDQGIVVSGDKGPFGLGFTSTAESATIQSISGNDLTLSAGLTLNHFNGARVTGIQHARVASVAGTTLTIDGFLSVEWSALILPVVEEPKLADIINSIFYFTGGLGVGASSTQGIFEQFVPGPAADNLTALKQGRAYWFLTRSEAFARATPLPGFRQGPIIPVTMQLDGVLFDPSGQPPSLPRTVDVVLGWNQIALIGERDVIVERGARGLRADSPDTRQFTSLVEFQKFIEFDPDSSEVEIVGGVFNPLYTDKADDFMKVGRGFYIFVTDPAGGKHTP